MRILFCVQGEGRGHLTQAMAAREIVESAGHEIVGVVVGMGRQRKLPEYFVSAMPVPLTVIPTLEFAYTGNKSVNMPATIARVLGRLPEYARSVRALAALVRELKPDVILNFYEVLTGVYALAYRERPPVIAIGHQFLLEHPEFPRMREMRAQQWGLKWYTRLVGARSTWLALSHYSAPDLPQRKMIVAPPLLRRRIFELESYDGGHFVLVYMVNHGYADAVIAWHERNPRTVLHCFYDKPGAPAETRHDSTLTFHRLDGEKFLQMMAECRHLVCTAGFESVCEAGYLGKPLLLVPVEGHVEQRLNAIDGVKAGLGVWDETFDLDRLAELPGRLDSGVYRAWVVRAREIMLWALEAATAHHHMPVRDEVISQQ
jgi:uncharacterized protein (TIGR00661 family)